jgi:hypothetical protein
MGTKFVLGGESRWPDRTYFPDAMPKRVRMFRRKVLPPFSGLKNYPCGKRKSRDRRAVAEHRMYKKGQSRARMFGGRLVWDRSLNRDLPRSAERRGQHGVSGSYRCWTFSDVSTRRLTETVHHDDRNLLLRTDGRTDGRAGSQAGRQTDSVQI